MSRSKLLTVGALALCAVVGLSQRAVAGPLEDLIAAAQKEGVVEFYASSTLRPQGAQAVAEAFNKKYGTNIRVNYHPSQNMSANVATVISQSIAGVAPEWDAMVVTDAHHATLWRRKLHKTFDYAGLGVDPKFIQYDNGVVAVSHQICLPAYNTKFLPAKDVPKSWEDLLDPRWKGKLAVTTATHHFARLAVGAWGEEKTTKYVNALVKQDVTLGRMPEAYTRLLLGEIVLAFTLHDGFIHRAKREGAPIVFANIEPVIAPAEQIGVLKGARHPNAAHLLSIFLTTPEAQKVWDQYLNQSSAFTPGTGTHKELQGKKVLFMTQDQANTVERLAKEYSKTLGFGR